MTRRTLAGVVLLGGILVAAGALVPRLVGDAPAPLTSESDPALAIEALVVDAPPRARRLGDVSHGRRLFERKCASCHGLEGRGDGSAADLVRARPRDLGDPVAMNARSDEDILRVVLEGGKATGRSWLMPSFSAELETLDAWDVIAFVRSLHLTVADILPGAVSVTAHEIVLRDPPPEARESPRRVVRFEALDGAGASLGAVAFEEVPAVAAGRRAWLAVASDGPDGASVTSLVAGSTVLPAAELDRRVRSISARLRAVPAAIRTEEQRATQTLAALREATLAALPGARAYAASCVSCHGATGQRVGPGVTRAGPGVLPARNLADGELLSERSDAELAEVISRGGAAVGISGDMPSLPLPPAELEALVAFVRSLAVPTQDGDCACRLGGVRCAGPSASGPHACACRLGSSAPACPTLGSGRS